MIQDRINLYRAAHGIVQDGKALYVNIMAVDDLAMAQRSYKNPESGQYIWALFIWVIIELIIPGYPQLQLHLKKHPTLKKKTVPSTV